MIRTVVVDDEERSRRMLRTLLERHLADEVSVIAEAQNATEAREAILQHAPHVVFLDIHMPGEDGLHLLGSIHPSYRTFLTVFVTAYDQYMLRAMRERALDFLIKPIDLDEFSATVKKIREEVHKNEQLKLLRNNSTASLLEAFERPAPDALQRLYLPTARGVYEVVELSAVTHCRAQRNYCIFAFAAGRELMVTKPMKDYEEVLEEHGFVRIHNSCMVSISHIQRYSNDSDRSNGKVLLNNGMELIVARRKKEDLLNRLRAIGIGIGIDPGKIA